MWRRSLFWKLFFTYTLIILFCMAVVGGYLVQSERRATRHHEETDLEQRARLVDERMAPYLDPARAATADSLAKVLGRRSSTRITVIAPDGRVIADSEGHPAQMENHRLRPEVQSALAGRVGASTRYSVSVFRRYLYVAIPSSARPGWVVRVSIPLVLFEQRLHQTTQILVFGAAFAAVLAIVLGFFFTRRITHPLESLREGLERLERGEFGARLDLPSPGTDEIGQLARTLNRVQEQLESTIVTLTSQRNERQAILSSMVEGLIAVDGDDRILHVNAAARHALGLGPDGEGQPLLEAVRIPQLTRFVGQVRESTQPLAAEMTLREPKLRYLELHGAPLRVSDNGGAGAVVVLNDVTRLRKLEKVRRDFVANVSHELKTPMTTIKGCLETLLEGGALEEPESARRFLGSIDRQTQRLAAIIEDLLYLSRLEYEDRQIALHPVDLGAVAERCMANFEHTARSRDIELVLRVQALRRWVLGDASLLARALDNLIDNGIKYSQGGGRVEVALRDSQDSVLLQVSDRGIGIPDEHLPRISERFYRVDTARSRELGGTGLGLAIVKHIAQAHGGSLELESRFGEGSRFTLQFPVPRS